MEVYIDNKKINYNDAFESKDIQSILELKINLEPNYYYTLMMIDPDAPSRKNPIKKFWLHWLKINMDFKGNNSEEIVSYHPPTPPINTDYHRYYICILKQINKFSLSQINKIKTEITKRNNFDPVKFEENYLLTLVNKFKFRAINTTG
jgi:large subunit ribosomal protein L35